MSEKFTAPWQSFVDCLSTVLLIMVFFSIILVILVSVLSYSISQKQMSKYQSQEKEVQSGDPPGKPSVVASILQSEKDKLIILYEGTSSSPTEEVIKEFDAWIQQHDPSKRRTIVIVQEMMAPEISYTERRNIAFRRNYYLSRHVKTTLKNTNVIQSYTVITGEKEQNRAIISFSN